MQPTVTPPLLLTESEARRMLLLRAFETVDPPPPDWSPADRDWATRVARASVGVGADALRFIRERTTQALHALASRNAAVRTALAADRLFGTWLLVIVAAAGLLGLAADQIGSAQRINLLAPPVWALVAWNLGVYVAMAAAGLAPRAVARGPRRWLRVLFRAPADRSAALQRFAQDWASVGAALHGERIAALLHAAAAALALGVVGGLYLRGVVLDYRVGWESTFLDGHSVHRVLAWLMAPASVLTGIGLPDAAAIEALRLKPGEAARGAAAPWLHLYAASLALAVLGPRLLLAAAALARAAWRARRMPWPAADPWLERVRAQAPQSAQRAWLLPHARALPAQAALAWRERLSALSGGATSLEVAEPLPYGEEEDAARCTPPAGTTVVLLAVDLATTPEEEVHGRWLGTAAAAAPALPRVLLADATSLPPERRAARRKAWHQLAQRHGARLALSDDDDAALASTLGA